MKQNTLKGLDPKPMGRPPVEEKKVKYNLYFKPSFIAELKAFAEGRDLSTSQLIENEMARYMKRVNRS